MRSLACSPGRSRYLGRSHTRRASATVGELQDCVEFRMNPKQEISKGRCPLRTLFQNSL